MDATSPSTSTQFVTVSMLVPNDAINAKVRAQLVFAQKKYFMRKYVERSVGRQSVAAPAALQLGGGRWRGDASWITRRIGIAHSPAEAIIEKS